MSDTGLAVIPTRQGQLGNRLFHFAHILAFCMERRVPLVHLAFNEYAELFDATRSPLFSTYEPPGCALRDSPLYHRLLEVMHNFLQVIARHLPQLGEDVAHAVQAVPAAELSRASPIPHIGEMLDIFGPSLVEWQQRGVLQGVPALTVRARSGDDHILSTDPEIEQALASSSIVLLDGWEFREPAAVERRLGEIKSWFSPRPADRDYIAKAVAQARGKAERLIGVHIRRRDYAEFMGGRYFFPIEAYRNVMQLTAGSYGGGEKVAFLVCSDEPLSPEEFPGLNVAIGRGTALQDMYSLAACDSIMGPPSTFSGWAAFYGARPLYQITDPTLPARFP